MKVISIAGAPGVGKSTLAAGIFYEIRKKYPHIVTELVTEVAKDFYWEGRDLNNQCLISGLQYGRLKRLEGKVDLVITDAFLIAGAVYTNHSMMYGLLRQMYFDFDNFVIFLDFDPEVFEEEGRIHTKEQSFRLREQIKDCTSEIGEKIMIKSREEADELLNLEFLEKHDILYRINEYKKYNESRNN